jgi:nucleoside-diphosphate-sugar epimerase
MNSKETNMREKIVVLGYGSVGKAVVTQLLAQDQGRDIQVSQRHRPESVPDGVSFVACDSQILASVKSACAGATQIVLAIGFAYERAIWADQWPRAMANVLQAAEETGARLVFVDNLYMYGPQRTPLLETMPLTSVGVKPAARAAITRQWMTAHASGKVCVTALRAPDFYGPAVAQSHLGDLAFGALAKGKPAMLIVDPDQKHDFAYVPDIARGVISLLNAPNEDFGQAWHIPCAPIQTPRQILALASEHTGNPLKLTALPLALLPIIGLFNPMMAEMAEMKFQWDRTYQVDSSKFAARFWNDPTPFSEGVAATLQAYEAV